VQLRIETPLTSAISTTPVDVGGPTAQVVADSLGSATGFAAFPHPGELVITTPGLLAGLFADQGIPTVPPYPLAIQSDAVSVPEASLGEGPYRLTARSGPATSSASASSGLVTGAGSAALLRSTAAIDHDDGVVRAEATTLLQGLAIGPLTIGEIEATAEASLGPDGLAQNSSLEVSGLRVGGIAVTIGPDHVEVAGTSVPLALGDALAGLLEAAGVSVRFLAGDTAEGRAVAEAIEISWPFSAPEVPGVGVVTGRAVLTVGGVVADLEGAAPSGPSPTEPELGPTTVPVIGGAPVPTSPPPSTPAPRDDEVDPGPMAPIAVRFWDLTSLYLAVGSAGVTVLSISHMVRRMGERG
jgi:hypothetical protein